MLVIKKLMLHLNNHNNLILLIRLLWNYYLNIMNKEKLFYNKLQIILFETFSKFSFNVEINKWFHFLIEIIRSLKPPHIIQNVLLNSMKKIFYLHILILWFTANFPTSGFQRLNYFDIKKFLWSFHNRFRFRWEFYSHIGLVLELAGFVEKSKTVVWIPDFLQLLGSTRIKVMLTGWIIFISRWNVQMIQRDKERISNAKRSCLVQMPRVF